MYSKQEASRLKQQFWTSFGQYMSPVLSAEGEKINWINYKTGEKNIAFKMEANNKKAFIGIVLTQADAEIQQIYFEHFLELKTMLQTFLGEEWKWQLHAYDENGKLSSLIFAELHDVSIFRQEDWPALISFFKPRIIALDAFWSQVKYGFEQLR